MAKGRKLSGKYITVSFARKLIGLPGRGSSARNRCIGGKVREANAHTRADVIKAFTSAAKSCR